MVLEVFYLLYAIAGCDVPLDDAVVCQFAEEVWCSSSFGCNLEPDRIELVQDPEGVCEITAGPQNTRSISLGPVADLPLGAPILISEIVSAQRFVFRDLQEGRYCARATGSDPDIVDQFVVLVSAPERAHSIPVQPN